MANLVIDGVLDEIRATQIYLRPFGANYLQLVTATVTADASAPNPSGSGTVAQRGRLIAVYDDNSTVIHGRTNAAPKTK